MCLPSRWIVALLCLIPCVESTRPQSSPPGSPYPGLLNDYLRTDNPYMSAWDFGANLRLREEDKEGAGTTKAGSNWDFSKRPQDDNNNQYLMMRLLPRIGYTSKWYSFLVEARSSYTWGDQRFNATAPGQNLPERDGPLDLHQTYVFIGNHKEFPVSLKIGRQELVYGDQRLVGHSRWNNTARTFDAIKARYQCAEFGVDVFTGGVVYNSNNKLNRSNSQDIFSGVYFNFPTVSTREVVESYLFARNVARGIVTDDWSNIAAPFRFPAPQDIYTGGVRLKSKPNAYGPWDYTLEAMYQFGDLTAVYPATSVAVALAAPRVRQQAFAFVYNLGYTWADGRQPRLGLIYSFATGDGNPTDGHSSTFQNLFPSNHAFYGVMDLSSLQNIHDLRLTYTLKPIKTVALTFDGHIQHLDSTSDYWYNVAGVPRNFTGAPVGSGKGYRLNPSYSHQLGEELDFVVGWSVTRFAQLEVGAGHFFRGDYVKQSLSAVGSKDANYLYLQTTFTL